MVTIELLKDFIDDLAAVLIVDAALGQIVVHLVSVDLAVAVAIELGKLLSESALLFLLHLRLLLLRLGELLLLLCSLHSFLFYFSTFNAQA